MGRGALHPLEVQVVTETMLTFPQRGSPNVM